MGRGEAPGSDLLREHRRLVASAGEHGKQLDAGLPDDLITAPMRRHVEGVLADLRSLWSHGDAWEKDRDEIIDLLNEATDGAAA